MPSLGKTSKPGGSLGKAAKKKLGKTTAGGGSGSSVKYKNRPRIGSTSSGRYSSPAPPPGIPAGGGPVPDLEGFLGGDSGYQQQLRQLAKSLTDFNADVTRRRGTLESEYGVSKKALGDQRLQDLDAIEEDYGSRGLLRSGLYAQGVG